jgi:hypothetical protein
MLENYYIFIAVILCRYRGPHAADLPEFEIMRPASACSVRDASAFFRHQGQRKFSSRAERNVFSSKDLACNFYPFRKKYLRRGRACRTCSGTFPDAPARCSGHLTSRSAVNGVKYRNAADAGIADSAQLGADQVFAMEIRPSYWRAGADMAQK